MEAGQGPNWGCSAKGEKKMNWDTSYNIIAKFRDEQAANRGSIPD
jgi:hypothetical protein